MTKGRMMGADAVCSVCETDYPTCKYSTTKYTIRQKHTLQAKIIAHAHASSTPSNPSTINLITPSLSPLFNLLNKDPQTSAIALCVSVSHLGNAACISVHVVYTRVSLEEVVVEEGTRRYLKREENVARRAVSAGAERERCRRMRRRDKSWGYEGEIVVRRSCASFCIRLFPSTMYNVS